MTDIKKTYKKENRNILPMAGLSLVLFVIIISLFLIAVNTFKKQKTDDIDKFTEQQLTEVITGYKDKNADKELYTNTIILRSDEKYLDIKGAKNVISGENGSYILQYDTEEETKKAYDEYKRLDCIKDIEKDEIIEISDKEPENAVTGKGVSAKKENTDKKNILSDEIFKTDLSTYIRKDKQKEVKVAVIDTGCSIEEKYRERIIDSKANYSVSGNQGDTSDDNGHGSCMAEIILSNTPDNVKIMPIKAADSSGRATTLSVYMGILKAIEENSDIINISMNSKINADSYLIEEAVNAAVEKGIIVVCSAGNNGEDVKNYVPSNIEAATVIGAVNKEGEYEEWSNYGETVDYTSYGYYKGNTGTSYAAARATSIIAELISNGATAEETEQYAIKSGTEDNSSKGMLITSEIKQEELTSLQENEIPMTDFDRLLAMGEEDIGKTIKLGNLEFILYKYSEAGGIPIHYVRLKDNENISYIYSNKLFIRQSHTRNNESEEFSISSRWLALTGSCNYCNCRNVTFNSSWSKTPTTTEEGIRFWYCGCDREEHKAEKHQQFRNGRWQNDRALSVTGDINNSGATNIESHYVMEENIIYALNHREANPYVGKAIGSASLLGNDKEGKICGQWGIKDTGKKPIEINLNDGEDTSFKKIIYMQYDVGFYKNKPEGDKLVLDNIFDGLVSIGGLNADDIDWDWDTADTISKVRVPEKTGYDFDGYYTSEQEGEETEIINENGRIVGDKDFTETDTTLYARWKPKQYTITYKANNGTEASLPEQKEYKSTVDIRDIISGWTKEDYHFKCWKSNRAIDGKRLFYPGDTITVDGDITFSAQWEENVFTVEVDAEDDENPGNYLDNETNTTWYKDCVNTTVTAECNYSDIKYVYSGNNKDTVQNLENRGIYGANELKKRYTVADLETTDSGEEYTVKVWGMAYNEEGKMEKKPKPFQIDAEAPMVYDFCKLNLDDSYMVEAATVDYQSGVKEAALQKKRSDGTWEDIETQSFSESKGRQVIKFTRAMDTDYRQLYRFASRDMVGHESYSEEFNLAVELKMYSSIRKLDGTTAPAGENLTIYQYGDMNLWIDVTTEGYADRIVYEIPSELSETTRIETTLDNTQKTATDTANFLVNENTVQLDKQYKITVYVFRGSEVIHNYLYVTYEHRKAPRRVIIGNHVELHSEWDKDSWIYKFFIKAYEEMHNEEND